MNLELLRAPQNETMDKALDFAEVQDVKVNLMKSQATSHANGTLYTQEFHMKNAESFSFYFDKFSVPNGCGVFVVTDEHVLGAFTHETQWSNGDLQTRHVDGSTVQVQLFCTPAVEFTPQVHIAKVATAFLQLRNAATCNIQAICMESSNFCNERCHPADASCSIQCTRFSGQSSQPQWAGPDWEAQRRSSVAVMSRFGSRYCSGNFINNANRQQLVLTANHCSVGSSDLLLHDFFDSQCTSNSNSNGNTANSVGDLTILASDSRVDNTLILVGTRIPDSWNVYLAGYDTTTTSPNAVVCLSHPSGSNLKIAHSNSDIGTAPYSWGTADHWKVFEWTEATTEGGSSGSALFDRDTKRIIGQLHGGSASCPAFNGYDLYGGLFASISQPSMKQYLSAANMDGAELN